MATLRTLVRLLVVLLLICAGISYAQQMDPSLFSEMKWRLVGPFRGGRALTATGVAGKPNLYYFGAVGGGVWKSTDAGVTWTPIFDQQPIASIGALAVAPSNPDVIYVGTGEADMRSDITYGNGVYKSTDAGKTWTHVGLENTHQIGRILVDPHNPDVAFVAALGHAYASNSERGVYRTTDGAKTWQRVLYKNDDTGAIDLAFDPQDSRVIFASLWQTRRPPWNVYPPSNGPGSGLYRSSDGGSTWQPVAGLPTEGLGRIGIAVAPSNHNRIYLVVDSKNGGVYRSDDGGKTWALADNERRIWGRGWYFGIIEADPKNADVVYVSNTSVYKSTDGGKTFTAFKGAPGGDDYHSIWIAPEDPARMIVSSDQGTIVTLNGGATWSSWYNQPTAQFYHVATDTKVPYWIYGAQQDSGAMSVPSRSNYASITERDWRPVPPGGESGTIAPDPHDAVIVYGGTVSRFNVGTQQNQDVSPAIGRQGMFRRVWTLPLAFSADGHTLYASHQMLFRTSNGGQSWQQISPDLTRENPGVPPNLDPITATYGLASPRKGVIYAIAPSPLDNNLVWVGTDDGLIHLTADEGQHWQNVTPKDLAAWSKVGIIEASHYDKLTAYAAIDRHRLDDYKPYIYRTHDEGKTWANVVNGIPDGHFVNVVREDPVRRGLLYAGTELGLYVSFDDGDRWQPLQLNLPVASIRDIAVHENDLVVATHGRSFWVLDDITPLRQITATVTSQDAYLFQPQTAMRVRPGSDQGTPYPPDIPHGDNPPNGAILNYFLKAPASGPATLEILDSGGNLVRRYSSDERPQPVNERTLEFPAYWIKSAQPLAASAGLHRFVWDLRYPAAGPGGRGGGRFGGGTWAMPGQYTVRLTASGKTYAQPLTVKMDPRVQVSEADLQKQFAAAQEAQSVLRDAMRAATQANAVTRQIKELQAKSSLNGSISNELEQFSRRLSPIAGPAPQDYGAPTTPVETDETSLRHMIGELTGIFSAIESADVAPTADVQAALARAQQTSKATLAEWQQLTQELPRLNAELKKAGLAEIRLE